MTWMVPAQGTPHNHGPEFGGSSPIGLVVILILGVAVVFLIRSMNKHLRKVPPSFDPAESEGSAGSKGSGEPAPGDGARAASESRGTAAGPAGAPATPGASAEAEPDPAAAEPDRPPPP